MDKLFSGSPYHGAEIGLYLPGAEHNVYVMNDWGQDICSGVMAHEYTHAWQNEKCPANQELAIREGFAVWIQYKYLDKIGAGATARPLLEYEDPVYGVGIKTMLAWEDKVGAKKMVDLVQHVSKISDGPH
jgi:aminopeptidase N